VSTNYITDEVTALIGMESAPVEATHPVEASEVRRFQQATMDDTARYWGEGQQVSAEVREMISRRRA